jgi:hypothetical protein
MATVKCKSGAIGWQSKLKKVYSSFDEFEEYDAIYNIANRLGFNTTKKAWDTNPLIQGSTNPSDLRVVKK